MYSLCLILEYAMFEEGPSRVGNVGYVRNEPLAHFKQITRDFRLRMVEKIMSCRPLYDAFSSVVFASHSSSFSRVRPVTAQARLGHWAGAARPPDSIASASSIPTPRRACTKRVANPPHRTQRSILCTRCSPTRAATPSPSPAPPPRAATRRVGDGDHLRY